MTTKRTLPWLLLLGLCSCFKTKDELTINADGSGRVRLETRSSIPPELAAMAASEGMMGGMGEGSLTYPPSDQREVNKWFPGTNFTVTTKVTKGDNDESILTIEAAFKDINALLASPYGRAHALTITADKGVLSVKALSAMEAVARMAEFKDDTGMAMGSVPGLADMQKKKDEMRSEFRITLPNALAATTGAKDGQTAVWIVEHAKVKDPAEFARQLGAVLEASCSADGVKFSPINPVRLGLLPFQELSAVVPTNQGPGVDTNKIAAAARFIPYSLVVNRSLDLGGEGGFGQSGAQLSGIVVLPSEFAPQKWGEPKLEDATDAQGRSLKPKEDENNRFFSGSRFSMNDNDDSDTDDTNSAARKPAEIRHSVNFSFKSPDWKVKEVARIKGSVPLQYFGASTLVIKLTNAIPANWIGSMESMMGGHIDSTEKKINDPKLIEAGITLQMQLGMVQGGMTSLSLQTSTKEANLSQIQVFDAEGHPWPTFIQSENSAGEESSCQVVVAGAPKPPLSLALLLSGGGATVDIPILVEHIPVNGK